MKFKKTYTARCSCNHVVLEATGPAEYTEYCHCKYCQRSSGSAFIPWIVFKKQNVVILSGELSYFQSSQNNKRGYCKKCGSTMSFNSPENFDIALGVMDDPEKFKIEQHIWTKSSIKHIKIDDSLPNYMGSPPS